MMLSAPKSGVLILRQNTYDVLFVFHVVEGSTSSLRVGLTVRIPADCFVLNFLPGFGWMACAGKLRYKTSSAENLDAAEPPYLAHGSRGESRLRVHTHETYVNIT